MSDIKVTEWEIRNLRYFLAKIDYYANFALEELESLNEILPPEEHKEIIGKVIEVSMRVDESWKILNKLTGERPYRTNYAH
jgi:hypothetical protein